MSSQSVHHRGELVDNRVKTVKKTLENHFSADLHPTHKKNLARSSLNSDTLNISEDTPS